MHRTLSVDFGLVLKNEIVLELGDEVETTLREETGAIQRSAVHV
jgi:hypothetical protein